jgi:hypothetical protein
MSEKYLNSDNEKYTKNQDITIYRDAPTPFCKKTDNQILPNFKINLDRLVTKLKIKLVPRT